MIGIYMAVILLAAAGLGLGCEYGLDARAALSVLALTACAALLALWLYERRRRRKLNERICAILNGKFSPTVENELSAVERLAMLKMQSLDATGEKLRRGYKNLSSLISDIAHQTKTPLSTILLCTDALDADSALTGSLRTQTEKLRFLMEALTKLSKCECGLIAGNLSPKVQEVSALIGSAVGEVLTAADTKKITIRTTIPDGLRACFDLRWTAEALFNILDNAVKYSPEGSDISITAAAYDLFVRIDIADKGMGIPEDELCRVWERFHRAPTAEGSPGVGIGLYLTREILTAEGGRVKAASDGNGSVFTVFLPANVTEL
ncbi:MAG: HAMP domain-containing histidine kinase [Clostridia bacterium]|nr:HAMP domain-containing histidine kinase [Clostridia bacterium]